MIIFIKDAPFTEAEKEEIIAMGVVKADWGYPDVVLGDPVGYFKGLFADTEKLVTKDGVGRTHYEKDTDNNPFE